MGNRRFYAGTVAVPIGILLGSAAKPFTAHRAEAQTAWNADLWSAGGAPGSRRRACRFPPAVRWADCYAGAVESARANPFQPGRGVAPPVIAGRDTELERAEQLLHGLLAGRMPSRDLLFYGPRGNGKTTLLIEIQRRARELGLRAERLPVTSLTAERRLIRELQRRAGLRGRRVTGAQVAGFGLDVEPGAATENLDELLAHWIEADAAPLVVVLDETQALVPEVARPFFEAVQAAKASAAPFLLLAAGTPDAPRRIREAATFNERGFVEIPVGRLERADTVTALAEPALRYGTPMSEPATAALAGASQDYPYFIQLLGSAAWDAAAASGAARIGGDEAERGIQAFQNEAERFYEARYEEARRRRIVPVLKPLASRFASRGGRLGSSEFTELVDEAALSNALPIAGPALENELVDLGIVWRVAAGGWELGIPSFGQHVLDRSEPSPGDRVGGGG